MAEEESEKHTASQPSPSSEAGRPSKSTTGPDITGPSLHQPPPTKKAVPIVMENSERLLNESASVDSFAGFQSHHQSYQQSTIITGGSKAIGTLEEVAEEHQRNSIISPPQSNQSNIPSDDPRPSSYLSSLLKITSSSVNPVSMLARQAAAFTVSSSSAASADPHLEDPHSVNFTQESGSVSGLTDQEEDDEEAFILATLHERTAHSRQATNDPSHQQKTSSWFNELQSGFKSARDSFLGGGVEDGGGGGGGDGALTDWDFWGRVINDYEGMIRTHPRQFQKNLRLGLPEPIRGMMWQLMSNSKNEALEEVFITNHIIIIHVPDSIIQPHPF